MTIAIRLPRFPRVTLRRAPRYERRPRVVANRHARAALSREKRWKHRGGSGVFGKMLAVLAALGIAAALWVIFKPDAAPPAPPLAFHDFVAQSETAFPEALRGYTRAHGGTLSDGLEVPVAVSLLLPAHTLESVSASPDALTRLSAPFVGAGRAISGVEMGDRIARLSKAALPAGITSCYTYSAGVPRRIIVSETSTVRAVPLEISFNPEC